MMPPRRAAVLNPLGADFDRFLYAQVGDDHQGGMLSVISALARVGVDPWEQAAILARLPVDGAVRALSALLAKLPQRSGRPVDPIPVATHLVTLLPRAAGQPLQHHALSPRNVDSNITHNSNITRRWPATLLYLACFVLLLVVARLLGHAAATATAPVVTPAPPVSRSR